MTAAEFLMQVLTPGLVWFHGVIPSIPASAEAALCLLTFALQETDAQNIAQEDGGPGRGPWQDEPETIDEVLRNSVTSDFALKLCVAVGIKTGAPISEIANEVYIDLMRLPNLATAFSRLDLWADPEPLPAIGDEAGCLACYARVWRPQWAEALNSPIAASARARFAANYRMAVAAIQSV